MQQFGKLFFLLFLTYSANARSGITDTIFALQPVEAKGVKFDNHSVGSKIVTIDSTMMANYRLSSLADVLSYQSVANVTTYGPGGHATIKMRGGGSDHTTIIWNGLNLKPAMSGELNCSALNVNMFDNIRIQPGGLSTMYGSGASTGVVFLSNKINLNKKGLNFGASLEGSAYDLPKMDGYGLNTSLGYTGNNFGSRIAVSYQNSQNEFEYKYNKKQKRIQEHAASNTFSLLQQNSLVTGANSKLETDFWYVKHFKEIPSLITNSEPGKTEQTDNNIHFALNYGYYGKRWFLKYRGGFLNYKNSYLGFDTAYYQALNQSWTYINELESKYSFNKSHSLCFGYNNTIEQARSSSYTSDELRHQNALFGRYSALFFSEIVNLNLEARQVLADGKFIPFIYSGGLNIESGWGLTAKVLGSKLYTLPDLNDLYWEESAFALGNPFIEPEYGWSTEAGLSHIYHHKNVHLKHELTIYRSDLKNAIIWLPRSSDGKYQPDNYTESITKGLEFLGETQFNIKKLNLVIGYDYAYTDAQLVDSTVEDITKQRRYIPKHKAGLRTQLNLASFSAAAYASYTGERNIDYASFPLDDYLLIDLIFNYQIKLKNSALTITSKIKNTLNTNYQIMSGYAQPGRSYHLGIAFNL